MIQETLAQIESKIESAAAIKDESKTELLTLLATLKTEIEALAETQGDHAESIARFVGVSAHEATRPVKNPRLFRLSIDGLAASVEGFEITHPRLVETVNYISAVLTNLGV